MVSVFHIYSSVFQTNPTPISFERQISPTKETESKMKISAERIKKFSARLSIAPLIAFGLGLIISLPAGKKDMLDFLFN